MVPIGGMYNRHILVIIINTIYGSLNKGLCICGQKYVVSLYFLSPDEVGGI